MIYDRFSYDEEEKKETIVECAVANDGFVNLNEVGWDFNFFDLLYLKEKQLSIEGWIWRLKDYIIRIGKIKLGETFTYLLLQVEYLPNNIISNIRLITDFLKQTLNEDLYKGFTTWVLKTFVYENTQNDAV